jgi:hypothetical protein
LRQQSSVRPKVAAAIDDGDDGFLAGNDCDRHSMGVLFWLQRQVTGRR